MPERTPATNERLRRWAWLFPATYAAHLAEEWVGDFPGWLSRETGSAFSPAAFVALNAVALVAVTAAAAVATRLSGAAPALTALGTAVLVNAMLHVGGSVLTASYSPGLVTGLTLWAPLGVFVLVRSWRDLRRQAFWGGIAAGAAAHVAVSALALGA